MTHSTLLTIAALIAFAANSILCRMALTGGDMDAFSFSLVRLASGALFLPLLVYLSNQSSEKTATYKNRGKGYGNWLSALMLMLYVESFSLAYLSLSAASGALILFAAVQFTMMGGALYQGKKPSLAEWLGMLLAMAGLSYLLLPGLNAPPVKGAVLMLVSGAAWGIYSLRGGGASPLEHTSGNFGRALILSLPLLLVLMLPSKAWGELPFAGVHINTQGLLLAICSGALASGLGYAMWYAALRRLRASQAAVIQLSVPILTAFAGVILLQEPITGRLIIASMFILGGIFIALKVSKTKSDQIRAQA